MGEFHFLPSGTPNDRHGGDGDWAFTEDGHFYFKSAGSWAQKDGAGGGGSVAGVHVTHKFPFTFDTPGLLTGATAVFTDGYTPAVGDILHDLWIEVVTAWDGTTPLCDVGTLVDGFGLWNLANSGGQTAIPLDDVDTNQTFGAGILTQGSPALGANSGFLASSQVAPPLSRVMPAKFNEAVTLKVIVSQTGIVGGANPGSTQGAAILYIITSTPA